MRKNDHRKIPVDSIANPTSVYNGYSAFREDGGMRKVDVLCEKDREIMFDFSNLCLQRLNRFFPLRLVLPLFQHFIDANVLKELDKSRLVITHAAAAFCRGADRGDIDIHELFEMTKEIDHDFAQKVANPFITLDIRHDDFAEIRKKRIVSHITMVIELLRNWEEALPFASAVKSTYDEKAYREIIGELLHLYSVETRLLGSSITFHGPAGRARDLFTGKLFSTMEKAAGEIAVRYARALYLDDARSSGTSR